MSGQRIEPRMRGDELVPKESPLQVHKRHTEYIYNVE